METGSYHKNELSIFLRRIPSTAVIETDIALPNAVCRSGLEPSFRRKPRHGLHSDPMSRHLTECSQGERNMTTVSKSAAASARRISSKAKAAADPA